VKRALSPKDLAAAIGVSESSLKRWADSGKIAVVRTEGGHRRIDIAEAVRFVRESGVQLVRPDVLGLAEVAAVANEDGQGEALYQHLAAGNLPEVRGLLVGMYLRGQAVAAICDGPILAAMTRLGELWRHDSAGVFIEHRATDLIVQAVTQLRALIEQPRESHRAVGGAPAGDPYLLPSMLAATVLASEGVRAVNLAAAARAGRRAREVRARAGRHRGDPGDRRAPPRRRRRRRPRRDGRDDHGRAGGLRPRPLGRRPGLTARPAQRRRARPRRPSRA